MAQRNFVINFNLLFLLFSSLSPSRIPLLQISSSPIFPLLYTASPFLLLVSFFFSPLLLLFPLHFTASPLLLLKISSSPIFPLLSTDSPFLLPVSFFFSPLLLHFPPYSLLPLLSSSSYPSSSHLFFSISPPTLYCLSFPPPRIPPILIQISSPFPPTLYCISGRGRGRRERWRTKMIRWGEDMERRRREGYTKYFYCGRIRRPPLGGCAADFSLLNLPKGKSLGRSKPATNS
jgi:hypothetical protein